MKPISTRIHGIVDYLSVATLYGLPRLLRWDPKVTRLLTAAAAGTLGYSLLTRYELGLVKVLPMPVHLGLDSLNAVVQGAAPFLFLHEETAVTAALMALALSELAVVALTQMEPSRGEQEVAAVAGQGPCRWAFKEGRA